MWDVEMSFFHWIRFHQARFFSFLELSNTFMRSSLMYPWDLRFIVFVLYVMYCLYHCSSSLFISSTACIISLCFVTLTCIVFASFYNFAII